MSLLLETTEKHAVRGTPLPGVQTHLGVDHILVSPLLGCGVCVVAWDPISKAGGMLHALLPDSAVNPMRAAEQPGQFVDTGLELLFQNMFRLGALPEQIKVCVVTGGSPRHEISDVALSQRNYEAAVRWLKDNDFSVVAKSSADNGQFRVELNFSLATVTLHAAGGKSFEVYRSQPEKS